MDTWDPGHVLAVLAIIVLAVLAALMVTRGLIAASRAPAPAMLVVSLSLLSLTALLGGMIFSEDSAISLAGAGLGALAGAVSAMFTGTNRNCPPEDPSSGPPDEQQPSP